MRRAAAASAPSNGNVVPFAQQPVAAAAPAANPAAGKLPQAPSTSGTTDATPAGAGQDQGLISVTNQIFGLESDFGSNPATTPSKVGPAIGPMQITPDTWNQYAQPGEDIHNAADNKRVGDRVVADLWNKSGGNRTAVLIGYNAGEGAMRRYLQTGQIPSNLETPYRNAIGVDGKTVGPEGQSPGQQELSRIGGQLSKVVEQLSKEGGRSEETWKRLRESTDKMNEYQQKLLELAQKPPSPEPRDIFSRLGSLATVVGILGGALTRSPLATSLEAGAAAMDAYNKNDLLTYQFQRENWKTQLGVIEKMTQFQNEQVRNVLYDERMEQGEKMNRLHALLAALGHEEQAAQAQLGDERSLRQWHRMTEQATENLVERRRQEDERERHDRAMEAKKDEGSGKLGKLTTFEVPDPADPKKRTQVTLQQGSGGQWFTLDKKPFDLPKDARPLTASQMGARESIFAQRGTTSGSDVRSDLKNITELPAFTTRGLLSGFASQPPVSMLDAAKKNLANLTMTDEASGAMTDQMVGVARALASLETGGVYVNQHLVDQYEKLAPQSGDSGLRVLRKLGIMRQNAENALEGMVHNPRMSDDQREYVKEIVEGVRAAIPWTPHDVNQLEFHGGDNQTILDFAKKQGFGDSPARLPADLPSPAGHVEGSTATDESGKVVAVIRNGGWVAP